MRMRVSGRVRACGCCWVARHVPACIGGLDGRCAVCETLKVQRYARHHGYCQAGGQSERWDGWVGGWVNGLP
jgi:hypothetical protein